MILVFGFMAYFGIELNVATSMLTSILIGVGIDYTIHFLWHYRRYVREGMDDHEAVIQTLTTSGKGIIFNAFSVMIGFVILTISGFLPIFFFGLCYHFFNRNVSGWCVGTIASSCCLDQTTVHIQRGERWILVVSSQIVTTFSLLSSEQQAVIIVIIMIWNGLTWLWSWFSTAGDNGSVWLAIWDFCKANLSILIVIYGLISLQASGLAELKFGKKLPEGFWIGAHSHPTDYDGGVWTQEKEKEF